MRSCRQTSATTMESFESPRKGQTSCHEPELSLKPPSIDYIVNIQTSCASFLNISPIFMLEAFRELLKQLTTLDLFKHQRSGPCFIYLFMYLFSLLVGFAWRIHLNFVTRSLKFNLTYSAAKETPLVSRM